MGAVFPQRSYSDAAFQASVAERIQRNYGITVDPATNSFGALTALERRLSACARIQRNYGLRFDYRSNSFSSAGDKSVA